MTKDLPLKRPAICVFCGSSHGADPIYTETAQRFGTLMAEHGFDLVFGGGGVGLMGEVAMAASKGGAHVLGIIPGFLRHLEPPLSISSEIVITETMSERKARMFAAADAFAVLPGGLGTLDEFSDAITEAQLHRHAKPIVLVNVKNYFAPLAGLIRHFVGHGFAGAGVTKLFQLASTADEAIKILVEWRERAVLPAGPAPAR